MIEQTNYFIGIEIGGTKLQLVAGDGFGHITHRWRAEIDPAAGAAGIRSQISATIEEIRSDFAPLAIGVGFGGPIDWRTGRIARSHQIEGWESFDLKPWLEQQTGLPTSAENDANIAALAEATVGAGVGADPMFYFNIGSGVGGGIIAGGQIYHGLSPGEAEFGHLRIDRDGATVESHCSGWAIDRKIRDAVATQPDGALARLTSHQCGGEARHLAAAQEQGDPIAQQVIVELANDLGFALSHVVHLLHPAVIVMGGGLSLMGESLRNAVAEALPRNVMAAFRPVPPVKLAALGEDAVPAGALILARLRVAD